MRAPRLLAVGALAVVSFVLGSSVLTAGAVQGDPVRFEILQAAYFGFSQTGPTNQSLTQRAVLLETFVGSGGGADGFAREAAYGLVNNSTRGELLLAEHHLAIGPSADALGTAYGNDRFGNYYRGQLVPTAIFDGLYKEYGGGTQVAQNYRAGFDAARARAPGASINLSGAVVLDTGFLDFEVFSPLNTSLHRVVLRGVLVEDRVPATAGGDEMRYVVRAGLSGAPLDLTGDATVSGRINFTVATTWIESRLAAIVSVQSDGPKTGSELPGDATGDFASAILAPLAVLVTGIVMAIIIVRYVSAERRAKLR